MLLKKTLNSVVKSWNSYKYRFLPWIIMNLKDRKIRYVEKGKSDMILDEEELFSQLAILVQCLSSCIPYVAAPTYEARKQLHHDALKKMEDTFGFFVARKKSAVGGTGVFIQRSKNAFCREGMPVHVSKGQLVALYPGTLYLPYQAIFFQSVVNPFIFRCSDGILIDGNDKGLSKIIYRSCISRDRMGDFYPVADDTWLTEYPLNPLNVGQYVNNQSKDYPSNVAYQEFTYKYSIAPRYRRFIGNLWNNPGRGQGVKDIPLKLVGLVATRDIKIGEELFSDYFTIIR